MAAWKENLLSLEHLSDFKRNTFISPREPGPKNSTAMHLQQRLQHLRERERSARTFNSELLQQFDQAQDILREMMASNDTMKTLRVEYERYLEKKAPYWQEQLQKKSEAVHKKKMDDYFSSHLKKTEEMNKTSADQQLYSQGLTKKRQKVTPPQEINDSGSNLDYDQDFSHLASSWLIQPQSKTYQLPVRVLHHLEGSSHVPPCHMLSPSTVPHLHHFDTVLGHCSPCTKQDGTHMRESLDQREVETNRRPSSLRESDGGSRSELLQETRISPVRSSCGHAESTESSRTSCQGNTAGSEKKKKTQRVSSDSERCSSERSPETSLNTDYGGEKTVQSSESYKSSDKHSLRSNGLLNAVASPLKEKVTNEKTKIEIVESDEDNSSSDENSGSQINESMDEDEDGEDLSPDNTEDDSERCKNIQGRVGRTETQTSDSSDEQSSAEEGDDEDKNPGEDSEKDEQHKERCVENIHRVYVRKSSEMEAEDELEGEHGDQRKINSHSQKKEDENKDDKKITSEEESNDEEEEKRSDITKEEESDSDDVIITPQVDRPRTMRNISEAAEVRSYDYEKEESEARSLDKDLTESSEDDIENMLSPQEPTKKLETQKLEDTPKVPCDNVESFQLERDSPTNIIYQSDSDEFDHFYD